MRALFILYLVIQLFMFPNYIYADDRCGNRIISEGDVISEVLDKCGPPLITEKSRLEIIKKYRDGVIRNSYINNEYLLYDFGPNAFIRIMIFEDDKLTKIISGEYGGKTEADSNVCKPPWVGVSIGDTMVQVRYRCGSPYLVETPEEITEQVGLIDDYYLSIKKKIVEWSYQLEKENSLSVLRFDNGILTIMYKKDLDQE
jgi:hypothetical protein